MQSSVFSEFIPPNPVKCFRYICSSTYYTEDIEKLYVEEKEWYGIIILIKDKCNLYKISSQKNPKFIASISSRIPKAHKKGGQSQNRIQRLRTELIQNYITIIEENVRRYFYQDGNMCMNRLFLCGFGLKKQELKDKMSVKNSDSILDKISILNLTELKDIIPEIFKQEVEDKKNTYEEEVKNIQEMLELNPDILVFGNEVDDELMNSSIEKIWCFSEYIEEYEKVCECIELNHYFLENFDGRIGKKFY